MDPNVHSNYEVEGDVIRFYWEEEDGVQERAVTVEDLVRSMVQFDPPSVVVRGSRPLTVTFDEFRQLMQKFNLDMATLPVTGSPNGNLNGAAAVVVWA